MLEIDRYPVELRREVKVAVADVLTSKPLPTSPMTHKKGRTRQLPAEAPRILALYGKGRSGKTALAEFIGRRYADVAHVDFSAAMIAEVNELLDGTGHRLDDRNKANARYRALLQAWAQGRRFEDPDYWLQRVHARVAAARSHGAELVVVAGLREPREKEAIERWGGEVWKIVRPGVKVAGAAAKHRNETALYHVPDSEFAHVIVNTEGGYLSFLRKVRAGLHERNSG